MPVKRAESESCMVCKKTVQIVDGDEMRLHLLRQHELKVAEVLDLEKVQADPVLQWIRKYISAATEMMQSANQQNKRSSNRKRPAVREEQPDTPFSSPAPSLRRSIRTSRSVSRELSTTPVMQTAPSTSVSRESSADHTPSNSSGKKTSTCLECGVKDIKQGLEQRHILQSHLDIPAFTCSLCDYVNTYNRDAALKHALRKHSAKSTASIIVDNTGKHETEITDLIKKCFPNDPPAFRAPISVSDASNGKRKSTASDAVMKPSGRKTMSCGLCGKQQSSEEFLSHAWTEHRRTCRRVYKCSMCGYMVVENRHRVQTHIGKEHDNHPDAAIVRDMDAEFRKLLEHCFGKELAGAASTSEIQSLLTATSTVVQPVEPQTELRTTPTEATVQCRLCDVTVPQLQTVMQQHVYRMHVNRPLFVCSDCPFSNSYRAWTVREHILYCQIENTHDQATVVDHVHSFMPEIERIFSDCFQDI